MVMFIVIASINRQTNPSLAFFADHDFAPLPFCWEELYCGAV